MIKNRDSRSLDHTTFAKMRRLYLIAFLLIALTIIIAQILIQRHLNSQVNDSRIVNIAGRQRMLSQKLVKELLLLQYEESADHRKPRIEAAEQDLLAFRKTHHDLQEDLKGLGTLTRGNEEVLSQFQEIESHYNGLVLSVEGILDHFKASDAGPQAALNELFGLLITSEKEFLVKMDQIVYQYDSLSQDKVRNLKRMELFLLSISLGILILEIVFLFRPISLYIKKVIQDLIQTQDSLKEEIAKVNDLYVAKENSLQELHGLNYAINNTALYANLKEDGSVIHMSKKFAKLIGVTDEVRGMSIDSLLAFRNHQPDTFKELIKQNQHAIWTGEVQVSTPNEQDLWLEMSVVPMNQVKMNRSVLLLCTDITKRIVSQEKLLQISEQKLKKEVDLQKLQASQIVEAQEEERKRISKDIHDGIGQMLTALKFNMESMGSNEDAEMDKKIGELKEILGGLIKEVRTVTFNLTPNELKDYGIVPTLAKLAVQLSKLTGKSIVFENRTDFKGRFDSLVETNLYRVVQEAVNNALKYAESNYILISLSHSPEKLSIVIDDDGVGFDPAKIDVAKNSESGMGMFFMKERINYINGRLFVHSKINEGTRITINLNL